jgi:hypothetical protein
MFIRKVKKVDDMKAYYTSIYNDGMIGEVLKHSLVRSLVKITDIR